MAKPQQILELEDIINIKLNELTLRNIRGTGERGFALNNHREVVGINLSYCNLEDIGFLTNFNYIQRLGLHSNKISNLTPIKNLTHLKTITLSCNLITDLRPLKKLASLERLYLGTNLITDISALKDLNKLERLELSDNKMKNLPEWILDFNLDIKWRYAGDGLCVLGNPLEFPPPEIIKQGNAAIKAYFDSLTKVYGIKTQTNIKIECEATFEIHRKIKEFKVLLVGSGGVGKTSLSKLLRNENFELQENQTHGINIYHYPYNDLILHFWDFGGQQIQHATHQFFLSKRSLYILVLDGRKEEDPEYWLKHIQSFGGDSPVLVVLNKIDEHPSFDLNRQHLLEKYPNIQGFYKLSCKNNYGLDEFQTGFQQAFVKVEMLQATWGGSWFNVKTELENLAKNYITCEEYHSICQNEQIADDQTQEILAQYLHDLGIIVHFPDFELNDTHILEPRWITEAVYKIINSKQLAEKHGLLCLNDLAAILKKETDSDFDYPTAKYSHIIKLMKKFELCYRINENHILIPDLLDIQQPDFKLTETQLLLRFRLKYDFLPKSIMPRFIVKLHEKIQDELRWRTGVVLYDEKLKTTALIRSDDHDKLIDIQVEGEQKRDFFAVIRNTLNEIHKSFEKLEITELVPLPDYPEYTVEYEELIGYEQMGKDDCTVGKLRKVYSVLELLNGIEKPEQRKQSGENHYHFYKGDNVQEKKVAKINNSIELTPQLELFYQVLKQINEGKKDFKPNAEGIEALKEFQSIVRCLKKAESSGYIDNVKYQYGRGRENYGMTLVAMVISGLTFEGFEVLNNPEKLFIDNDSKAAIDMRTIHTTTYVEKNNGNIAGRDVNVNNTAATNADINVLLEQLVAEIKALNEKVPASQTIADISQDAELLVAETQRELPRKNRLGISLDGIKEAALAVGEMATPIVAIAEKLSPLLGL
jgi:small GTP-binding protein